ncbi:MAG: hypothetical protein ACKV2Q_33240 [Planctomycetaceae bacterium]
MFDYPIPPLRTGLYGDLGLSPEATAEEINEARLEQSSRLKSQLASVNRELDVVYQRLPGLREAKVELTTAQSKSDPAQLRAAQLKLASLEEQALRLQPQFKSLLTQQADLERRVNESALLPIQNPEERLKYDASHPPLELIKLADCATAPWNDRKTMLALVREELASFFEQAGEPVFHPSDLTRSDFSHDFTHDPTLDRQP